MKITFQSFNIQHGRNFITKQIDLPKMSETIALCGSDIVALNEVYGNGTGELFIGQANEIAKPLGLFSHFEKAIDLKSGEYGNAILSRFPIISLETQKVHARRIYPEYYEDRSIINALVDIGGRNIRLIVTHMGLAKNERSQAVTKILAMIAASAEPVVLMGDFNMTPDDKLIRKLRAKLQDCESAIKGDALTFPSDKPNEKIDYIFLSKEFKILSAAVPEYIAADHRTIVCEAEI